MNLVNLVNQDLSAKHWAWDLQLAHDSPVPRFQPNLEQPQILVMLGDAWLCSHQELQHLAFLNKGKPMKITR